MKKKTISRTVAVAASVALLSLSPAIQAEESETASAEPRPIELSAGLPEGFPQPGPADQIVLKTYPAYRVAHAEGGDAFMQLFRHIKSNGIAMTAPVEMTLEPVAEGESRVGRADMFFMYARPDMGQTGPDADSATPGNEPRVHVADLPPAQALSLGFFGYATPDRINQAVDDLRAELETRNDLVAAGPPRLFGYHDPRVPADRRFSEVQIPVVPAEESNTAAIDPAQEQAADPDAK
ncbi:MAG: heme-binding protein [Planctomycetota bacterium]